MLTYTVFNRSLSFFSFLMSPFPAAIFISRGLNMIQLDLKTKKIDGPKSQRMFVRMNIRSSKNAEQWTIFNDIR